MEMAAALIGGIGLFVLGMGMMTGALKELVGEFIKTWMNRIAGGTGRAIFSGALITAIIQSSTAVTLLTIGFVSAGLLPFRQSIGVIMGANIGSTSTGWLVSLIGFKVDLLSWALPIVGIGVLAQTVLKKRQAAHGTAIAGFGLLFLGVGVLQTGMADLQAAVSFEGMTNIFLLIVVGTLMTVIMQSSSVAVATTLTALFSGVIGFEQAVYLVIGQNIGTTLTAVLAAIGAGTAAKRAGLTHVLFNLGTAVLAVLLSPLLIWVTRALSTALFGTFDAAVGIAIFHTLFNVLGVLFFAAVLPWFVRLLEWLVPEKGDPLLYHLEAQVAEIPEVALEAAQRTIQLILSKLFGLARAMLAGTDADASQIAHLHNAAMQVRTFLAKIETMSPDVFNRHVQILHALDHIDRLLQVLSEPGAKGADQLHPGLAERWLPLMENAQQHILDEGAMPELIAELGEASAAMAEHRKVRRDEYFVRAAKSGKELDLVLKKVEALLWYDGVLYHFWRAAARLGE
ncbi:Na/Pi symporter [Planococcus sp. APC 3906]|uniref:Na/Pi cotransporter family protein n=1 Tax=Planococcus sp. APC 3906 TaxID=3035194 RepID=UPI0025B5FE6A|nr:Na/Pi symporter [Planococcus sp. APC 3906]MDN3450094.1 Na/Pi symporter [Planococcus sp. APC 3906]